MDRMPNPANATRARAAHPITGHALLALLSGALSLMVAPAAQAGWPWPRVDDTVHGRLVDVQIEVEGERLPLYPSPRWDARHYFEASRGREYAVTLRNTTPERIGVLVSVDGLNVITGQRSALAGGESMYVLDPYGSATIRGWRTSLSDIRRFVFVDEQHSYATRSGQANGDLGWVRVLAFREQRPIAWRERRVRLDGGPTDRAEPAAPAPETGSLDGAGPRAQDAPGAARKDAPGEAAGLAKSECSNPGTGWGRAGYDPVQRVEFTAQSDALDRIVLRYEYPDGLRALGIVPLGDRDRDRTHQRDRGELGFAQPPRW